MVVKVYISGISGNKEVKKRQQRVLMILDSKNIKYDVIDITEPGREADKDFMQSNSKSNGGTVSDPNPRSPLPPQMFNDDEYCGDYDQFDLANEVDTLEQFLKLEVPPEEPPQAEQEQTNAVNGDVEETKNKSKESSPQKETSADEKAADKEGTPPADDAPKEETAKEEAPAKEGTPVKEGTPAKETKLSREPTPAEGVKESTPVRNETTIDKEASPERQKSDDKEEVTEKTESPLKESELEAKKSSKEATPDNEESVNENGTVSSRGQSEEKDVEAEQTEVTERKKDNPSEGLIQSEQAAAAE